MLDQWFLALSHQVQKFLHFIFQIIQFPYTVLSLLQLHSILFPKASNDSIMNFFYSQITLAFGLYPMSKLSELQIEAIKLTGLNYIPVDFKKTYMACIYQALYCIEHSIEIKKP